MCVGDKEYTATLSNGKPENPPAPGDERRERTSRIQAIGAAHTAVHSAMCDTYGGRKAPRFKCDNLAHLSSLAALDKTVKELVSLLDSVCEQRDELKMQIAKLQGGG
jgi:hypothetical protein